MFFCISRVAAHRLAFYETDSLTPLQYSQPLRHPGQRCPDKSFMFGTKTMEGAPPHPFGFAAVAIQGTRLPAQACADSARLA